MDNCVQDLTSPSLSSSESSADDYDEEEFGRLMQRYLNLQVKNQFIKIIASESQEWDPVQKMIESRSEELCHIKDLCSDLKAGLSEFNDCVKETPPSVDQRKLEEATKLKQMIMEWEEGQASLNQFLNEENHEYTNSTRFCDDVMQAKLDIKRLEEEIAAGNIKRAELKKALINVETNIEIFETKAADIEDVNESVTAQTGSEQLSGLELMNCYVSELFDDGTVQLRGVKQDDSCFNAPGLTITLPLLYVKSEDEMVECSNIVVEADHALKSLVKEMIRNGCSIWSILMKVHLRWANDLPLMTEIHNLKNKFGVDWLSKTRELHVLVGDGKDVCLHILPHYPAPSSVKLLSIKGRDTDKLSLPVLQLGGPTTLSDWVKYLQVNIP